MVRDDEAMGEADDEGERRAKVAVRPPIDLVQLMMGVMSHYVSVAVTRVTRCVV